MMVCGEGGDVFMVSTQRGQIKPKWPTHKDPGEKRKEKKSPRGYHGHRRAGLTRGSHGWRTRDP